MEQSSSFLLLTARCLRLVSTFFWLAKSGSITPHTKFTGQVYVLTHDEGGRHKPFFNGYRPQFYFRTTDVTGVAVSYTHLRAHETKANLVCRLLLEKKKK